MTYYASCDIVYVSLSVDMHYHILNRFILAIEFWWENLGG